ncbi:MAG: hypothetical protein HFF36_06335 [Coprobacillus sp.]|nr:hypothetical protein [Coprobacillus sp.]
MQGKWRGYCISKNQVFRDKTTGKIIPIKIHDKDYAKIWLDKNIDFGGVHDKYGTPFYILPEQARASYLVPYRCVQNHRYNDRESYISVPEDYHFRISVDLGATGNILPDGRNEHSWTYIENISVDQMCDYVSQNKYVSFIISKNQKGKDYTTQDNSRRTTIIIPEQGGKYAGCRITCSVHQITDIAGHPNIYKVSLPPKLSFAIQKSDIKGIDSSTGKNIYGETKIINHLKGFEIAELFKNPKERERLISMENTFDDLIENDSIGIEEEEEI